LIIHIFASLAQPSARISERTKRAPCRRSRSLRPLGMKPLGNPTARASVRARAAEVRQLACLARPERSMHGLSDCGTAARRPGAPRAELLDTLRAMPLIGVTSFLLFAPAHQRSGTGNRAIARDSCRLPLEQPD